MRKYLFILIAALLFIVGCSESNDEVEVTADIETEKVVSEPVEEAEEEVSNEPETLEDHVQSTIEGVTGNEAEKSDGKDRIVEISTIDDAIAGEGFKIVNIELNADEHATVARTRDEMLLYSKDLFPALLENEEVSEVSLNWDLPLIDDKGNENQKTVMTITLRSENAADINWDNFDVYAFETVAERYYEDSAIQE